MPDIRFIKPFRRRLLGIYPLIPENLKDRYLGWLYPDNCIITFTGDPPLETPLKEGERSVKNSIE